MLNHCEIMGRFVRDPELRSTTSGTAVASFAIASERNFKNKNTGEKQADFIDCIAWRQTAEHISRYFNKGQLCVCEGTLQSRTWESDDGKKHKVIELVVSNVYFCDSKKKEDTSDGGFNDYENKLPKYANTSGSYANTTSDYPSADPNMDYGQVGFSDLTDDDGDLPF